MVYVGSEAVRRVSLWPAGSVDYSQSETYADGYRQDCSGFVSMCWGLPTPGENTESLVTKGIMHEIPTSQLAPGDALGMCGPGTLGDAGHIQLFLRWSNTGLVIAEQAGGQPGPITRTLKGIPTGYKAYRLSAPGLISEDHVKLFKVVNDDTVWVSDGMRRRALRSWPLVEAVYGSNPPILEVGSFAELDDAAGPVDALMGASGAGRISGSFSGTVA